MALRPQKTSSPESVLPLAPEPFQQEFRKDLHTWYRKHARELPWRGGHHPYGTWLSEIMLQQTRVSTVIDRYSEFLRRFPTLADLAAAPEDDVLALWSGLGYYRRARMLHRGAQFVVRELGGVLPGTASELRTLPGIGEYTAAAIASIAFGESIAVLDGNVERVLLRLLGLPEQKAAAARNVLLRTANTLVPPARARRGKTNPPGDHNQAMMELGAPVCLPRGPLCLQCPVFRFCHTRGEHPTAARTPLRSRQVACLLATRKRGVTTEVLLERRAAEMTLMPGMLELPPLPLEAVAGREPVLRLRHSITDTNYYVEVYSEAAPDGLPYADAASGEADRASMQGDDAPVKAASQSRLPFSTGAAAKVGEAAANEVGEDESEQDESEEVFRGERLSLNVGTGLQSLGLQSTGLRSQIPAAEADLLWYPVLRLHDRPLTGLARKALQRLGLMPMLPVQVRAELI